MRIPIFCAATLLTLSTAAWSQKSYCDKKVCKAWTGSGWYVVYGSYLSKKQLKGGPFQDQESCKVEAAQLAKKNPEMVSAPIGGSNANEVIGEFYCLIIDSGEKAAEEYMNPI